MPLRNAAREVQLLEIHDISLRAAVSTATPGGDVLSRFNRLLSDFALLQAQQSKFQDDFVALGQDVASLKAHCEAVDKLREELGDIKDENEHMRTHMHATDERAGTLERHVAAIHGEVESINQTLDQ